MGAYPLTKGEAHVLNKPPDGTVQSIIKALHLICLRRYREGSYFPSFSLLGIEYDTPEFEGRHKVRIRKFAGGV